MKVGRSVLKGRYVRPLVGMRRPPMMSIIRLQSRTKDSVFYGAPIHSYGSGQPPVRVLPWLAHPLTRDLAQDLARSSADSDGPLKTAAYSKEEVVAWKETIGRSLQSEYAKGTGGHALGTALRGMALIHNADGAEAVAKTLMNPATTKLLNSSDPLDICHLQQIETRHHAEASDQKYTTLLGTWLKNLSVSARAALHIVGSKIEGTWGWTWWRRKP